MVRANGSISAPRRPSTSSGRVSGIFGISLGDSLSLSEFGAFTFEDELFSQLQFFRHGARHQDLGTSPNLGRTAPMCTPQQQRSAAGAQQQRCGLSGWAVTHMGQSHVGHTAHTHTHTRSLTPSPSGRSSQKLMCHACARGGWLQTRAAEGDAGAQGQGGDAGRDGQSGGRGWR